MCNRRVAGAFATAAVLVGSTVFAQFLRFAQHYPPAGERPFVAGRVVSQEGVLVSAVVTEVLCGKGVAVGDHFSANYNWGVFSASPLQVGAEVYGCIDQHEGKYYLEQGASLSPDSSSFASKDGDSEWQDKLAKVAAIRRVCSADRNQQLATLKAMAQDSNAYIACWAIGELAATFPSESKTFMLSLVSRPGLGLDRFSIADEALCETQRSVWVGSANRQRILADARTRPLLDREGSYLILRLQTAYPQDIDSAQFYAELSSLTLNSKNAEAVRSYAISTLGTVQLRDPERIRMPDLLMSAISQDPSASVKATACGALKHLPLSKPQVERLGKLIDTPDLRRDLRDSLIKVRSQAQSATP